MKQRFQNFLRFISNPRLLLCVLLAWLITNGWSYILLGLGTWLELPWMVSLAGAYLTWLWLPVSPEKLATFAIAIALLRWLFPNDQKTLAVLRALHAKAKQAVQERKEKKSSQNAK